MPENSSPANPPPAENGLPIWRLLGVSLLCLAAAVVSGLLLLQHHGEPVATASVQALCGTGQDSGCDQVSRSPYAKVAGVPLAALGLFFYLSLTLLPLFAPLAASETRDHIAAFLLVALGAALLVDAALWMVQMAAIKAYCRFCLLTYVLTALAAAAVFPAWRRVQALGQTLQQHDGRLLIGGWLAAAASLAMAVWAAEVALASRERERAATLLGVPVSTAAPTQAPSAAAPPDVQRSQEEARAARAEVARLQGILDDPQKLDQYYAEKAAREYDQAPVQSLKLDSVPFKGPGQAPIRVVEYSDFLCPYCRGIAGAFANFLPTSGGRVAVYFKNYPLDKTCNPSVKSAGHPGSCWLALGGLCAQEQGRFWPYHDKVFATTLNNPQSQEVVKLATEVGLEAGRFEACLKDPRTRQTLAAQIAEGQKVGVEATPTLFINGKRLPRINDFVAAVDKESGRLGLPPLPRQPQGQ